MTMQQILPSTTRSLAVSGGFREVGIRILFSLLALVVALKIAG